MKPTDKESIKKFLDLDKTLFHSNIFFPNEMIIGENFDNARTSNYADVTTSTLYMNSKYDKNGNMYANFIDANFRKPLANYYGSKYGEELAMEVYPYVSLMDGENRRYLGISKAAALSTLLLKSLPQTIDMFFKEAAEKLQRGEELTEDEQLNIDDGNVYEILKKCLKADRSFIKSVIDGTAPEDVSNMFRFIQLDGSPVSPKRKQEMLGELYDKYTQKIIATKFLKNIFGKELDSSKFMECFDYDKLCLIMALSSFLDVESHISKGEGIPGSMMYLYDYCNAVKMLREKNPRYNETIKITTRDDNGRTKQRNYTTNDVMDYLKDFLEKYPEIKSNELSLEDLFKKFGVKEETLEGLTPKEYTEFIQELLEKEKKLRSLTVNWEILPTKEGEVEKSTGARTGETTSKLSDSDIAVRGKAFNSYIASLPVLFNLKGVNDFEGYVAHVFSNGKVILEKPKTLKKAGYYSATYVMSLDAFFDLSSLSRTEIMDGLSSGDITGVKRIYHTYDDKSDDPIHSYKERIGEELEGSDYNEDMINSIYATIEAQKEKTIEHGNARVRTNPNK